MNPILIIQTHNQLADGGCSMAVAGVCVRSYDAARMVEMGFSRGESRLIARELFDLAVQRAIVWCEIDGDYF